VAEYHVENFGCRASRADGEIISADLRNRGLTPAQTPAQADVIVANTCSVTAQADRTARAFLRKMHRENPTARILVTGCYAQRAPQELAALPGVHAVIGNSHKALVPELAQQAAGFVPLAGLYVDDAFAHSELAMPQGGWRAEDSGQTRPNLKVQEPLLVLHYSHYPRAQPFSPHGGLSARGAGVRRRRWYGIGALRH
jgi:threonylcarbamoyladenosine tRNA methylthiotransferase MtaB